MQDVLFIRFTVWRKEQGRIKYGFRLVPLHSITVIKDDLFVYEGVKIGVGDECDHTLPNVSEWSISRKEHQIIQDKLRHREVL